MTTPREQCARLEVNIPLSLVYRRPAIFGHELGAGTFSSSSILDRVTILLVLVIIDRDGKC